MTAVSSSLTADVRAALQFAAWLAIVAYSVAWLIVAVASDPTWWWFVPIYGDVKIFQESIAWGFFHVGLIPAVFIAGAIVGSD